LAGAAPDPGLTAVAGLEVGHHTLPGRPTGCTAVLARGGATAGVDVRGSAPGSREHALLDPRATVECVHGVLLSGGSAFGLAAADGVMRYLEEAGVGFETGFARVPIVPAAILFDLGVGDTGAPRPDAEAGYQAAVAATTGPVVQGSVGAGAGATVGKLAGMGRAMRGGLGSASLRCPDGTTVAALFAVNALGDVLDPADGRVVAGVRTEAGDALADARRLLREGIDTAGLVEGGQTTLGIVATDATLSKAQTAALARMAQVGLARSIYPVHTPWDGDTVFALATGAREGPSDLLTLGALAADVAVEAILRGVRRATSLPGLPAVVDLV
jgi:L-aminopeptidase/D-esterase-like protein